MQGRSELHCDGLPLMPEHGARPSLSPPHRGGPCAISHEANSKSFTTCGEEELVRQVHTLFVRSAQQVVVYELQVREVSGRSAAGSA